MVLKKNKIVQKDCGQDKNNFQRKMVNGQINKKYVDLLDVDKPIAGQNYGCFSFISPEKILKEKNIFYFEQFVKQWDMNKSMEKFHDFLNFISYKYKLELEEVMKDLTQFVEEEKKTLKESSIVVENDYKNFLDNQETILENEFNKVHNFQTSVRGIKNRGNFNTQEEAELRAKTIREMDPHFDVFVGPVGTWLCFDPDAYKTGRVEYLEEELNQLAHEKMKNEEQAKNAFEQRIKETKEKAIDENKKNALKYGNVITQDVDAEGNLFGVGVLSQELKLQNKEITIDDIRSELFEGNNIVTSEK